MKRADIFNSAVFMSIALTAVISLSSCATDRPLASADLGESNFGEASQQTFEAQIKNPNPVYDHRMESSGERASQAVERYRTDTIKQPAMARTSSIAVGASGSGSSSSGSGAGDAGPNSAGSDSSGAQTRVRVVLSQPLPPLPPPTEPFGSAQNSHIRLQPDGNARTDKGVLLKRRGAKYIGPDGRFYSPAGEHNVIVTSPDPAIPTPPPPQTGP